jgi:hypothetical protein
VAEDCILDALEYAHVTSFYRWRRHCEESEDTLVMSMIERLSADLWSLGANTALRRGAVASVFTPIK